MICVSEFELAIILDILRKHTPDCEVRAFGSRYKWTPKEYSDLDIAIVGRQKMDFSLLGDIRDSFEESDLPFRVDVLDWHALTPEFQAIIEQGYEVIYSPLPTQRAIAATLSCLDDKIELNRRINANLEAQAQAIFKSWFVDFEPWGGVMPDNWRKAALGDLCTLVTTIKALPLLLPPMETLAEYSTLITPIFKQVFRNYGENRTLAAIRDTLLPKLMSGELEVEGNK